MEGAPSKAAYQIPRRRREEGGGGQEEDARGAQYGSYGSRGGRYDSSREGSYGGRGSGRDGGRYTASRGEGAYAEREHHDRYSRDNDRGASSYGGPRQAQGSHYGGGGAGRRDPRESSQHYGGRSPPSSSFQRDRSYHGTIQSPLQNLYKMCASCQSFRSTWVHRWRQRR